VYLSSILDKDYKDEGGKEDAICSNNRTNGGAIAPYSHKWSDGTVFQGNVARLQGEAQTTQKQGQGTEEHISVWDIPDLAV